MREERKFTETQRSILAVLKVEGAVPKGDLIGKVGGNEAYVAANIHKLLDEGFIYSPCDGGPLAAKVGVTNLDITPTHEWRWDGQYIEGERLPGCAGPAMIEWPDASNAPKLEDWLAHYRRKCWFSWGNELEITALFRERHARRQSVG